MKVDYDVVNYKKFEWYGNQRLDDACENYCDEIKWSWFKTEEERDKEFNKWNKGEA